MLHTSREKEFQEIIIYVFSRGMEDHAQNLSTTDYKASFRTVKLICAKTSSGNFPEPRSRAITSLGAAGNRKDSYLSPLLLAAHRETM